MSLQVFLINLDDSTDRLEQATTQLAAANLEYRRVSAFDGRSLQPADFPDYDDVACRKYMGRSMTGGEIGCFVSHKRALQAFLESDARFGLVLEDDFQWTKGGAPQFAKLIEWLKPLQLRWEVINIGAHRHKITTPVQHIDEFEIARAHYFPMLGTALLWSREGAETFMDATATFFAPFDNMTRHVFTRTNRGFSVWPPLVQAVDNARSEIDSQTNRDDTTNRTNLYGFAKQRRLWTNKIIAMRHKFIGPLATTR